AQECLILRSYRLPDGQLALEVRVLATGETMTVIDGSAPPEAKSKPGLLPWGKPKASAAPMEYVKEQIVSGPPADAGRIQPIAANPMPTPAAEEYRTIQEPGKSATK